MLTRYSPTTLEFSESKTALMTCPIFVGRDQLTKFIDPDVAKVGYEWDVVEFGGETPKNKTIKISKTHKTCLKEFCENFTLTVDRDLYSPQTPSLAQRPTPPQQTPKIFLCSRGV